MMMSFIHSHYADQIQLDDIADFAHVSKNTCMQIFKNGIRQSPISYLIQYRLKKAAKLLATTEMKVIAISEQCGFHDAPYFCVNLKRFTEILLLSTEKITSEFTYHQRKNVKMPIRAVSNLSFRNF